MVVTVMIVMMAIVMTVRVMMAIAAAMAAVRPPFVILVRLNGQKSRERKLDKTWAKNEGNLGKNDGCGGVRVVESTIS